jgi:hypothetical protein
MEPGKYRIIEERLLSKEEALKGLNFETVMKKVDVSKFSTTGKWLIIGSALVIAGIVALLLLSRENPASETKHVEQKKDSAVILVDPLLTGDTTTTEKGKIQNALIHRDSNATSKTNSPVAQPETEEDLLDIPYTLPRSLPFKMRGNADAETAIQIRDSVYGPANVSVGRGDLCEYDDQNSKKSKEKNSAWFKFTIQKDTLLTFHIVPTLKTDDYDFALFKCDNYSCLGEIKRGKYKPVRYCFSWNTTHNCNTGLSDNGRDTTWQNKSYDEDWRGKTYAPALRVKAGETYYLMITISNIDLQNMDPEGFMIYFYKNLPKGRANTYNPKYGE